MTKNRWLISDTHFGQESILHFCNSAGDVVRGAMWDNVDDMDTAMVDNWNRVVAPHDTVYHLGDAVSARRNLPIIGRLNGKKQLIMGNHDIFKAKEYLQYFTDLHGAKVFTPKQIGFKLLLTHMPIKKAHGDIWKANVHGHTHTNMVMKTYEYGEAVTDKQYINVCVENINYTPIHFDEILERVRAL